MKHKAMGIFYATNCYPIDSAVELELIFEKALIKLTEKATITYNNSKVEEYADINETTGKKTCWGTSHSNLINDFYYKLAHNEEIWIDGTVGIQSIKILQAIYTSHRVKEYIQLYWVAPKEVKT